MAIGDKNGVVMEFDRAKSNGVATLDASGRLKEEQWPVRLSNPNLLHNWYFVNPINQRGEKTYSTDGYTIDRWRIGRTKLSLGPIGIGIEKTSGDNALFFQYMEEPQVIPLSVYTFSILVDKIGLISVTAKSLDEIPATYTLLGSTRHDNVSVEIAATTVTNGPFLQLTIRNYGSEKITVIAAKLELGPDQTLARKVGDEWVLNDSPPDPALELAKCQRYQIPIARYFREPFCGINASYIDASFPLPVTLRDTPKIVGDGLRVYTPSTQEDFAFSVAAISSNAIRIRATKAGHGFALGDGSIGCDSGILLDANL